MFCKKILTIIGISLVSLTCGRPRVTQPHKNISVQKQSTVVLSEQFDHVKTKTDLDDSLRLATKAGILSYVQQLVEEYGADITNVDEYGDTLLHHACSFGFIDVVKYLVDVCKMDVNVQGMCGDTPLHCAISNGHYHIVRYLIDECGADIYIKNNEGLDAIGMMREVQLLYQAMGYFIEQAAQIQMDKKVESQDVDMDALFDELIDEMVEHGAVSEDISIEPLPQWKIYLMRIGDFVLQKYDVGKQMCTAVYTKFVGIL
ncbi:MAG TPA: ankyrin repeat domain-containing protein [Candidatus Dependentiae bacterium]|nr:ankyrin repeat domain-containing protein [Candidatus Dependentiae bacterium]HRQ62854.1 ankyrin repeat domain-containing protein [Candidatus Dependentiae bacterium]